MKPTAISRNKLSRMSDRELTDLWQQTGKREYAVALLLNYLPFVYGVVSKYAHDAVASRTTVSEFAAAFPEMADRFTDSEPFSYRLYQEVLRYIGEKQDDTYSGRREFIAKLSSGAEDAVAVFAEGKSKLTKPQRECIERFLLKGETFGYISENTGYLRQNIRSYIEAGIAELAPTPAAEATAEPAVGPSLAGMHNKFVHYIKGESGGATAHEIELRSMRDRFLADALEGYDVPGDHTKILTELDKEISAGIFPSAKKNAGWLVAAAVILALIATGFFIFGNSSRTQEATEPEVAVESHKPAAPVQPAVTEVNVAVDSISSPTITAGAGKAAIVSISERSGGAAGEYVSAPEIGIRKYNEYLDKAVVKPADGWQGEITLSFIVNKYGRPSRIRIIKYLSQDAHREAIRLLNNGPEWTPTDEAVTIVMMFE